MKFFSRIISLIALTSLALVSYSALAADLGSLQLNRATAMQQTQYVAADGTVAMRIKCLRALSTGASLTATGTTLLFTTDGTVAETGLCDTGGTPGTIDMAQATANTFGEVADIINASTYWRCILVAARPSQACSTSAILTALAENATTIFDKEGIALTITTSVSDWFGACIGPERFTNDQLSVSSDDLLNRRSTPLGDPKGTTWQNELLYATETATIAGGTTVLSVYAVASDHAGATEVLLYTMAGGTTTVATPIPILPKQAPIKAPPGWRIVVQCIGSNLTSAASIMQVHGLTYRVAP
jgi:hypothetical protein